jgi:hypothetical protein
LPLISGTCQRIGIRRKDDRGRATDEASGEVRILGGGAAIRPQDVKNHVLTRDESGFAQSVTERLQRARLRSKSSAEPANPVDLPSLLRPGDERRGERTGQ